MKIRISVEQQNKEIFINSVIEKYHFDEAKEKELIGVYDQMLLGIGAYAAYRINTRVTGVKEIDNNQSAIVAMTLGAGVDRLQESYIRKEQLEKSYMLECIANELLLKMYKEFNKAYARFHRRYVMKYVFIGNDISLTDIPKLLEEIKGKKNGEDSNEIRANEYGVLFPSKSVVFYAVLSENPKAECEGICAGCENTSCQNRYVEDNVDYDKKTKTEEITNQTGINMNYGFQRIFGKSV